MAMIQQSSDKLCADTSVILDELTCPICKETLREPFATTCGHTFCHSCIQLHLQNRQKCPCCNSFLTTSHIHPIFALEQVIRAAEAMGDADDAAKGLKAMLAATPRLTSCAQIDELIATLTTRRTDMQSQQQETKLHLLLHFLEKARSEMLHKVRKVKADLSCLAEDISQVRAKRSTISVPGLPAAPPSNASAPPGGGTGNGGGSADASDGAPSSHARAAVDAQAPGAMDTLKRGADLAASRASVPLGKRLCGPSGPAAAEVPDLEALTGALIAKKKAYVAHFDELQACYLAMCRDRGAPSATHDSASLDTPSRTSGSSRLADFCGKLNMATQYVSIKPVVELLPATGPSKTQACSTIEFNCDQVLFAAGGLSQRIKIYDYASVLASEPGVQAPVVDLPSRFRVSCLSWSPSIKEHLLSCGASEGAIVLNNAVTLQEVRTFEGHTKRAWSVDFSRRDPTLFVSGSDDTTARVWSTNQAASVMTLPLGSNVCCCAFSPADAHTIAVGTAGHAVRVYDLRNTKHALAALEEHSKAVSYVKFMGGKQLVSASVDNSLCRWDIPSTALVRSYSGHTNKKNFVGLSINEDYIACGSETSQVYVYYKDLSRPILEHTLTPTQQQGSTLSDAPPCFTSAVAWKPGSTHLLAASSTGHIHVTALSDTDPDQA